MKGKLVFSVGGMNTPLNSFSWISKYLHLCFLHCNIDICDICNIDFHGNLLFLLLMMKNLFCPPFCCQNLCVLPKSRSPPGGERLYFPKPCSRHLKLVTDAELFLLKYLSKLYVPNLKILITSQILGAQIIQSALERSANCFI